MEVNFSPNHIFYLLHGLERFVKIDISNDEQIDREKIP